MSAFILDASVAAAWLLEEDLPASIKLVLARLEDNEAIVPVLWHMEIRNVLLVARRRGRLGSSSVSVRLNALSDLPIRTDANLDLEVAFAQAEKHSLSIYDAVYLELAKRLSLPMATLDKALAKATVAEGLTLIQ